MNQKKLITILATIAIIAIMSLSLFFTQLSAATATTYNASNMTVTGVLATDSYVLYPFTKKNLIFGFSKYGELINGAASPEVGLKYDGMDVFANPNVLEKDWSQGWFIDIHYADGDNNYKNAWAFAMYSDLTSAGLGQDWAENAASMTGTPHSGRKTNVWATTDDIKVLYDGPREFIALTNTTLYRASTKTSDDALVSITIMFVFNKDKKIVILFKDIKRLDRGKWGRTFQVEFSNRGEWDIGTSSSPPSYAHFYTNQSTVYDYEYHDFYGNTTDSYRFRNNTSYDVCQIINEAGSYVGFAAFWPKLMGRIVQDTADLPASEVLGSVCTVQKNYTWEDFGSYANKTILWSERGWSNADYYPTGAGQWDDKPMVFKNGIMQTEGSTEDYEWFGDTTDKIIFADEPVDTDYITIVYKHNKTRNDMSVEPKTPYVIGEWCFDLNDDDYKRLFRAVTVYGLTDRHDADDVQANAKAWSNGVNKLDAEVEFYLNETFNPYDLYNAVHKQESRWVDIRTLTTATNSITLTEGIDDTNYYNISTGWQPYYISPETWTGDTDPVESTWVNEFEDGATFLADFSVTDLAHSKNWALDLNATFKYYNAANVEMLMITPKATTPNATAPLTLQLGDLVDFDFWYNPIDVTYGPWIEINVTNNANPALATQYFVIQAHTLNPTTSAGWHHYTLNTIEDFIAVGKSSDTAFSCADSSAGIPYTGADEHSFEWWTSKYPDYYVHYVGIGQAIGRSLIDDVSIAFLTNDAGKRHERVYNMEEDKLIPSDWDAYCSFAERVLVNGTLIDRYGYHDGSVGAREPYYTINFETGLITFSHWSVAEGYHLWDLGIATHIKVLYSTIEECTKGRYEWMVVGKDAATIDSIGAAYMTEAWDSIKDIEVQWTALDINETAHGPLAPFVMGYGRLTGTKADYRDSLGRPHLRDDWCSTTAVASSNMLFSGGPLANLGAEYFNEFTRAMWMRSEYVVNDTGHASTIFAVSCWNRQNYTSTLSALYGYAVVSVYKDLNGTIGFLIWGHEGQDTYYAAKWFWDEGIVYLQTENRGVTDIILKIYYSAADPTHPSVSRVERLGTISEKSPHDC